MPFDPRKPWSPSGIRLGTPALTTRGLTEEHMPQVAAWMDDAITAGVKDDADALARIAGEVADLHGRLPDAGLHRLTAPARHRWCDCLAKGVTESIGDPFLAPRNP